MKPLLLPNQNKNKDENISLSISVSNLGPNLKSIWKIHIVTKNCKSGGKRLVSYKQCGNSKIFLPLRFYVKSNLAIFLDNKNAILTVLGAQKRGVMGIFNPFKCEIFSKVKIRGFQNDQNCSFWATKFATFDFT